MVLDSINRSDIDIRKELLSNIIVCGGNTLLPGVVEKLQQKVSETAPQAINILKIILLIDFCCPFFRMLELN